MSLKLFAILAIPLSVAAQDRKFNYTITQTAEAVITAEQNYKETSGVNQFGKNTCIVDTELQIDGEWHKARGEYSGTTKEESCKTASILARKNLTTSIKPSTIKSIAEVTYEENGNTKHIDGYKKGNLVDVNNLHVHPDYKRGTVYQGTICKWFYDVKREAKGIKQYNLIACKLSAGWVVESVF